MENEILGRYFARQPGDEPAGSETENEALAQVQKVIDHIELLKQMESIDSEVALKKVKKNIRGEKGLGLVSILQRIAAVLVIPLLIFSIWQFNKLALYKQSVVQNEISTPATLRSVFTLPDGTKVWMNGGTSIKYPTQFTSNERLIELDGEAYFDVVPDKQKPFLVKTGNLFIEAVGTEFNCLAYSDEKKIETVLTQGKVNILMESESGRKILTSLEPNQMAVFNKENKHIVRNEIKTDKYVAWREGKIIFKNDNMQDVLLRLGRWYNVEFISDSQLKKDYAFTGSFEGEELTQILNYIELTTPVRFEKLVTEKNDEQLYLKTRIKIKEK